MLPGRDLEADEAPVGEPAAAMGEERGRPTGRNPLGRHEASLPTAEAHSERHTVKVVG
jgi:hypothetical protein